MVDAEQMLVSWVDEWCSLVMSTAEMTRKIESLALLFDLRVISSRPESCGVFRGFSIDQSCLFGEEINDCLTL